MKKKFTMLFAALLAFVGVAKAQTAATYADGLYKIYWQSDNRGYLTYHEGEYPNEPQLSGVTLAGCADKHYASDAEGIQVAWYLYTSEKTEKSYLFEATTGKFIAINPAENAGNGKTCVLTTEVSAHAQMNLFATDGDYKGSYMFRYTVGGKDYHFCSGCGSEKNAHPVRFSGDGQKDGGSRFVFVADAGLTISDDIKNAAIAKIEAFESKIITVTYKYVYGDQVWGTEVVEVVKGEAYTQTTAPFGVSFTYPEGVVADDLTEGAEVEITCTLNGQLPFVPAANYASIKNWYHLNIHKDGYYLGYEAGQTSIPLNKTSVPTDNIAAYAWAFIGNPFDGYYQIVNYAAGEGYILSSSTNTADGNTGANTFPIMTKTPVPEGNNTYWVPSATNDRQNGFYLAQKDNASNKMNRRDSKLAYWNGGADAGSTFNAIACDPTAIEVTVKYSFTYEGVEKYSQEVKAVTGNEWPAITVALPYGVSATKPAGVIGTADMVDGIAAKAIELSVAELPFVAAANNNSIEHWYYINIHTNSSNTGFLQYTEENKYIACELKGQVAADNKDAYTWAFVGNIFDGFKLVNKKAGIEQAVNSDGSSAPVLDNYATGVNWQMITSRTNTETQYFCFKYPDGDCLNAPTTGQLSFWWDNDNGSTMWVTERDDAAQIKALVENAKGILAALGEGETVGYVTAASKTTLSNAITTAETAMKTWEGIDAAEAGLQEALANLETIQPEEGKYYTIVSSCTDDHRAGQEVYVNNDGGMQFAKVGEVASEIARVFQFVPANDGKFYLYNIEKDAYMKSIGTATEIDATKAKPVTITNLGAANIVKIVPDGQNMMHAQDRGSVIVGWNNNSTTNGSAWKIVETNLSLNDLTHSLTVSEAGWATLVLGYNTTIPTGVKAYAVSEVKEGYVTLAEVENEKNVLPAHTPVLIEAAAGTYVFNYTATEATVENNLLIGSVFNITVEGDGYVLANGNNGVGLYKAKLGENGTFKNNANKAYLPAPADGNAPAMFAFSRGGEDEDATGIDQLINANGEVVIYDLAGRRVEKMEKGIYIVNGKKVIR